MAHTSSNALTLTALLTIWSEDVCSWLLIFYLEKMTKENKANEVIAENDIDSNHINEEIEMPRHGSHINVDYLLHLVKIVKYAFKFKYHIQNKITYNYSQTGTH